MSDTIDVKEVLQKMGYTVFSETATVYQMRPLYRDSDNNQALAVNKQTGEWYDFVERVGGKLDSLIARTLDLETSEQIKEFLENRSLFASPKDKYELDKMKRFDRTLLYKLKKDHSYWLNRRISEQTITIFEGGTTTNGRMKNRYVFPIFNSRDEVVGFSGRSLVSHAHCPKWKHIGMKNSWCYPLKWNDAIISTLREAILLESIGDMLALWNAGIKNTIVTFGVTISPAIIRYLLRIDARKIFIAFNNDSENNMVGNDAADEGKVDLSNYFDRDQITIAIPDQKDFGEMQPEQIDLWKTKYQVQN